MRVLLLRIRLFFSSYAPLFLILAIRFNVTLLEITCGVLAVAGAATLGFLLHALRGLNATPYKVTSVGDRGADVAGYLATYLLPFVMVPEPSARELVAYILFLVIVGVVYVRSNMTQVNPLLYLLGYRIAEITTIDGWNGYLVSRKPPKIGDTLLVSRMLNTVALERPNDQRLAPGSQRAGD